MQPTLGRIVLFVVRESDPTIIRPAIVSGLFYPDDPMMVDLHVFVAPADGGDGTVARVAKVSWDSNGSRLGGTWFWPPR